MARFVTSLKDPFALRAEAMGAKESENMACANCQEPKPEYVCMDFRTFVCKQCSEVHTEFGHRTMSIADPEWEDGDVELMAAQGGNRRAAKEWLAFWSAGEFARPSGSDPQRRRDFIRKAYVVKCWQRQPRKKRQKPPKLDDCQQKPPELGGGGAAALPAEPRGFGQRPRGPPAGPPAAAGRPGAPPAHGAARSGASTPTTAAEAHERDAASLSSSDSDHAAAAAPGGAAASPRGFPLLRPPAPPAPLAALRLLPPPPATTVAGEAWTAHFGTPRGGGAGTSASEPQGCAGRDAREAADEATVGAAGSAPQRPALPAAPSCPASPAFEVDSPLEYEWYTAAGAVGVGTPEEPLTPRTKPCHHPGGDAEQSRCTDNQAKAAPEKRGALSWGAFEDRFSALGDVASLEQDEVPSEFGELVQMFNDRARRWEPGREPEAAAGAAGAGAPAAPPSGAGSDDLAATADFGWL